MMRIYKKISQVFDFRLKLLRGHRKNADELKEVQKERLADVEKIVRVV